MAEEKIDVSGFPWMKDGESRIMSFGSLTTNRLCSAHNHALSPLAAVAGQFFQAIKGRAERTAYPDRAHRARRKPVTAPRCGSASSSIPALRSG
jgi:hypothetical protein